MNEIEALIEEFVSKTAKLQCPIIKFNNIKNWKNIFFNSNEGLQMKEISTMSQISFSSFTSLKTLASMLNMLSIIYKLKKNNMFCTKRDIFYQNPKWFGKQSNVDSIIETLMLVFQVPRINLNLMATSKGLLSGDLQYRDNNGVLIDCKAFESGMAVPNHIENIQEIKTSARFVLIIEKDASYQKLINDKFQQVFSCLLITGKGFPDMNTRLLINLLWRTLHLPIFCLVDADPYGIEILSVYKYGSKALSQENKNLAVPDIKWIGILPSDIDKLHIPQMVLLVLSKADIKKAHDLLQRNYVQENLIWKKEIDIMLKMSKKAEIQCLDAISSNFLIDVYLASKLKIYGF